jgi:hypothetical protein
MEAESWPEVVRRSRAPSRDNSSICEGDSMLGIWLHPWHALFLMFVGLLYVASFWQLFKKAGYVPAVSLVMIVPYLNILAFLWLAFSDWPVLKRLRDYEGDDPPEY